MSIARKITEGAGGGGSGGSGGYVDDVFSTYLYEGTGAPRDIVNGIDLDDKGGLVWIKSRGNGRHQLFDTERGAGKALRSESADAESTNADLSDFNSDGFSLIYSDGHSNANGDDYASWTWAKQEGFFDVVEYTGNGGTSQTINHNLGSEPGMIIVKATNSAKNWEVFHRSTGNTKALFLNETNAANTYTGHWNDTDPTSTDFTVGSASNVNGSGIDYVAYLFAHDAQEFGPDGDESIIKCGSVGPAGTVDVDLGWEPQFLLWKQTDGANDWYITDTMRGFTSTSNAVTLRPNQSAIENASNGQQITSTGFTFNTRGNTYVYMAIRRPMKPAEEFEPDELFAVAAGITSAEPGFTSGFPVDMAWYKDASNVSWHYLSARLIQNQYLVTNNTDATTEFSPFMFDYMKGYMTNAGSSNYNAYMFRRAPGFFDVVTYEGVDADAANPHGLGVVPEMVWIKRLNGNTNWWCWHSALPYTEAMNLEQSSQASPHGGNMFTAEPTDETFTTGYGGGSGGSGGEFIAYLWASVPGICDIGTYTGNGPSGATLDIDCGFTNGARFVLVKRTDDTGNWMYFDALRGSGISLGFPLALNNADAQLTTGQICFTIPSGFRVKNYEVNGDIWNTNIDGAEYIYMAIA